MSAEQRQDARARALHRLVYEEIHRQVEQALRALFSGSSAIPGGGGALPPSTGGTGVTTGAVVAVQDDGVPVLPFQPTLNVAGPGLTTTLDATNRRITVALDWGVILTDGDSNVLVDANGDVLTEDS